MQKALKQQNDVYTVSDTHMYCTVHPVRVRAAVETLPRARHECFDAVAVPGEWRAHQVAARARLYSLYVCSDAMYQLCCACPKRRPCLVAMLILRHHIAPLRTAQRG